MSYLVMALHGRLGNHLWQFAAGLGMAKAVDAQLCFDSHRVQEPVRLLPDLLPAHYREATAAELRRVGVASRTPGARAGLTRYVVRGAQDYRRRLLRRTPAQTILYDGDDDYRQEFFELDLPAYVAGYFHDERFLEPVADEVDEAIRWPVGTAALPAHLGETVAVSFRRGDYNVFDAGLPVDYYDRAMRMLADAVEDPTFVLFGDDPAFVDLFAERAERRGHSVVSALPLGHDPITQLRMQSECDHAIVANSSFAWWGAWLGDRRHQGERIVIGPAGTGSFVREQWTAIDEVPGVTTTYDLSKPGSTAAMS